MDINNDQIEKEFRRQVYLCSGLGAARMRGIISEHFGIDKPDIICRRDSLGRVADEVVKPFEPKLRRPNEQAKD